MHHLLYKLDSMFKQNILVVNKNNFIKIISKKQGFSPPIPTPYAYRQSQGVTLLCDVKCHAKTVYMECLAVLQCSLLFPNYKTFALDCLETL